MKKLFIMLLTLAMIFAMAACGSKETTPETTTETAEVTEESRDALAGTTYQITESSYEGENGEMVAAELDAEKLDTIVFGEDGTYTETYYEPDFENNDLDTKVERKVTGTYTIEGKTVVLSESIVSPTEEGVEEDMVVTEEMAKAMTPTITMEGDTIVMEIQHFETTDADGVVMAIPSSKNVFTKVQ